MDLNEAQIVFSIFFAIYFTLIIDRSHETYRPYDTYNAWLGKSQNINRLFAAWIVLFLLPILQFAIMFTLLGIYDVTFEATVTGVVNIMLVSISSFYSFGYFRIYEALLHGYPRKFFSEEEQKSPSLEIRPYFWAHLIPGILYVAVSTGLLVIALYL